MLELVMRAVALIAKTVSGTLTRPNQNQSRRDLT